MHVSAIIIVLCVLATLTGVFVWLFTRVQEHHRAHYSTLIAVAGKHSLSFSDDPDPTIRLRLEGNVDGVKVRILSRVSGGTHASGSSTEICALFPTGLAQGTSIVSDSVSGQLSATGKESDLTETYLSNRQLRQSMSVISELNGGALYTSTVLDDKGLHLTVSKLVDNIDIVDQSLSQMRTVKKALIG